MEPEGHVIAPLALGLSRDEAHRALDLFRATGATFCDQRTRAATGLVPPAVTPRLLGAYVDAALASEARS